MQATSARRIYSVLLAIGAAHCGLHGQTPLRFDVASVRRSVAGCRGRWDFRVSHGAVTAENAPLLRIISRAYNLTDDRVAGPSWLDSECYDVRARASTNDVPDRDLMTMLQELLKERLHLVAHDESEERPAFVLLPDKAGIKMHPDGDKVSVPTSNNNARILFMAKTLDDLCERLGKVTGRPVIDKTGLHGRYVIVLSYLPFDSTSSDPSDPAAEIFSAVRDQLGLRLEPRREVVNILTIEKVEKAPTEN